MCFAQHFKPMETTFTPQPAEYWHVRDISRLALTKPYVIVVSLEKAISHKYTQ
jgi:hypothetical protein